MVAFEFLMFGDDTIISIMERDICMYFPTDNLKICHVIESMGSFFDQLKNTFKSTQEMSVVMSNLKEFVEGFGGAVRTKKENIFVTMEG